jgi:hypothetical protein
MLCVCDEILRLRGVTMAITAGRSQSGKQKKSDRANRNLQRDKVSSIFSLSGIHLAMNRELN